MIPVKTLCCLVFLGVVLTTWGQEIDESALAKGDFVDVDVDLTSYEDTGSRSIFGKKKGRCTCKSQHSCGCCAKPRILGWKLRGCLNTTLFLNDHKLEVALNVNDKQIAQYNFSVAPVSKKCSNLPGKLSFLKFCLFTNTTETEENGLTSCNSLDIIYKETTVAIVNFSCLRFKDGKLDFALYQDVDRDTVLKVKIRNPISAVKNLVNKMLQKKEEA